MFGFRDEFDPNLIKMYKREGNPWANSLANYLAQMGVRAEVVKNELPGIPAFPVSNPGSPGKRAASGAILSLASPTSYTEI